MMDDLYQFEQRIYGGRFDWRWEVRHEGLMSTPFASGVADTRKEAQAAIDDALNRELTRLRAPWRPVRAAVPR